MKLIKPSFKIQEQQPGLEGIYKIIELAGRTCYKSTDKITDDSANKFVSRMIESKHYAMLEHGTVYLTIPSDQNNQELISFFCNNNYSKAAICGYDIYVTTNFRVIVENMMYEALDYLTPPTPNHILRCTVHFICNRQVSHEFVRHRVFSFAQESTRYCNYSKDKFGNELTFIQPCWDESEYNPYNWDDIPEEFSMLYKHFIDIESQYNHLIRIGWKPQQAAIILPNAIKTELVMTGFVDDDGWEHFFALRALGTTGAPHPQAKELAEPLMHEFLKRGLI